MRDINRSTSDDIKIPVQARIADGLVAVSEVAEAAPQSLDLIVVDAGSGDASLVMSCPPPPFLEAQFLRHAHAALKPSGMLAVNCVTRLDSAFEAAAAAVQVADSLPVDHTSGAVPWRDGCLGLF